VHNATNNPFWSYSLTQYSNKDCETFCLEAQNRLGLDINLILFGVWLATQNRALNLDQLPSYIEKHQRDIIAPLRDLRKSMRDRAQSNEELSTLRNSVKGLELQAEQLEQWWLFQFSTTLLPMTKMDKAKDKIELMRANLKQVYRLGRGTVESEGDWIEAAIHHLYPS